MAEEAVEKPVVAQIPVGIARVANLLNGMTGADVIMENLGKVAIDEKIITFKEKGEANTTETKTITEETVAGTEKKDEKVEVKAAEKKDEKKEEGKADTETIVEDDLSEEDKKNPLLNKKIKIKSDFKFENIDQIKEASKKVFGIEIKDDKDFSKLFTASTKWRDDAQKLPAIQEELDAHQSLLDNAPAVLITAMKAFFDGDGEWMKVITSAPQFDFTKPVEKQDIKILVNSYFPGEFTQEDWDETTEPKALTIAKQSAKEKFSADKRELDTLSAGQIRDAKLRKEAKAESVDGSLAVLKQSFPELDKTDIKDIQKVMESGDINSLFINKNGTWKPDAAEKIMMALYGKSTIMNLTKTAAGAAAKKAETKANEEILSRGADTPAPNRNTGASENKTNPEVIKKLESLTKGLNKKTTY